MKLNRLHVIALVLVSLLSPLTGRSAAQPKIARDTSRTERTKVLMGTRATYCSDPRIADGRVDVDKLVDELVEIGANTYSFCIHAQATDWDDLKLILPRAREKGIRV